MGNTDHHLGGSSWRLLCAVTFGIAIVAPSFAQQPPSSVAAADAVVARTWIPTGSLNVARESHTATLLRDGRVLVTGGGNASSYILSSAELYDPATGTWTVTGPLAHARRDHSATLLRDGRVLVVGGSEQYVTPGTVVTPPTAEVYDPASGSWTVAGDPGTRWSPGTLLPSGAVFFGESGTYGGGSSVFDPATNSFVRVASMPCCHDFEHAAALLPNGKVLVVGGWSWDGGSQDDAHLYDPASDRWTVAARTSEQNFVFGSWASTLPTGRVLAMADTGKSAVSILYDANSDSWGRTGALSSPLTLHRTFVATPVADGSVIATGGTDANGIVGTVEGFSTALGQWSPLAAMNVPRAAHTVTLLRDGRVLAVGGISAWSGTNVVEASAELYDASAQPGTIGAGFTGSWYDPAQVGHGLLVEVLPGNKFLAAWFAFDPAGAKQAWFVGVGTYRGDSATITEMVQPTGGRWIPNFDPARVVINPWGTLKFTFTDCNHGRVEFASTAGYGVGSMNLTRLTQPAGLACP